MEVNKMSDEKITAAGEILGRTDTAPAGTWSASASLLPFAGAGRSSSGSLRNFLIGIPPSQSPYQIRFMRLPKEKSLSPFPS